VGDSDLAIESQSSDRASSAVRQPSSGPLGASGFGSGLLLFGDVTADCGMAAALAGMICGREVGAGGLLAGRGQRERVPLKRREG
jgi:hypothetical protein